MPQLGESVVEGTVSRWLKAVGETVAEYEPLLEVVSDKVDTEIPSPAAGTLQQILVPAGETVAVGTVLAYLGEASIRVDDTLARQGEQAATPQTVAAPAPARESTHASVPSRRAQISPAVSRIAAEHGIGLDEVLAIAGSGQGGRVTKLDLERYLTTRPAAGPAPAPPPLGIAASNAPARDGLTLAPRANDGMDSGLGRTTDLTPMRAAIAEHMVRSKQTSAHVTSIAEVDMSRVIAYRDAHRDAYARQGVNLTYTAFFIQAAVEALKRYPIANASLVENKIVIHPSINIGIAVALEHGLIVPVIKRAEELSLKGLAATINDLATRARGRRLAHDDVRGGTFTVTNPGMQGVLFGTAIINQPQAAILGVGAIAQRVVVVDGAIAIRPMVYLSLTYDHRIMDGAGANDVLVAIRDFLQQYPG